MVATLTALGLGAANPAFASGGETPDPASTPVTPVIAVPEPEIAVPDVMSDLASAEFEMPQIETSIQTDGVNTNVDVRVLSAGSAGAVTQADAAPGVISAGVGPDITPTSGDPASTDASATEAATRTSQRATHPADAAGSEGANTNVSVRVLSPGDDGPVTQVDGPGEASPDAVVEAPLPSDSTTVETPSAQSDSVQYQDQNSRYQFSEDSADEPWFWVWTLTSNCADIVDSISTQTGDPKSLDWHWEWGWTWACDGAEDSKDTAGPNDRSPPHGLSGSSAASSTDSGGAGPSTTTQPDGTWSWTWTFVLCGREMTVSRTAASGTPLTWDWSWAWSWTCPPIAGQGAGADTTSGPADTTAKPAVDDAPVPSNATATADAIESTAGATTESRDALDTRSIVPLLQRSIVWAGADGLLRWTPVTVTVGELPPLVASGVALATVDPTAILVTLEVSDASPHIATATTPSGAETWPTVVPWPNRAGQEARRPGASATTTSVPAEPAFRARARAPHDTPEARPAPRRSSTSSGSSHPRREPGAPPLGPQGWLQLAGSASGGGSSSGVVPFGFATVTGFFVLAPPRLRRRVRPAQELGPRDRYPSPIDKPG